MKSDFEATHIKQAIKALDKHLSAVEIHSYTNEEYKKGILKEPAIWEKLLDLFKS